MNIGDFAIDSTFDFQFTTSVGGVPTTLADAPSLSAYENNTAVEITAGLTLTLDFNGKVGTHNVHVVASVANGYESGKNYTIWLAAGSVGGVTIAPRSMVAFSIANRAAAGPVVNATALLDLVDAIEAGMTPREALRLITAAEGGKVAGAGTANVSVRNAVADDKVRIAAVTDASGNRLSVTTDLT
jgi:hypothetical protein